MSGLSSFGAGGGYSASSSARSGDSSSGPIGITIQGITTGGYAPLTASATGGGVPSYVWLALLGLGALVALKVVKR